MRRLKRYRKRLRRNRGSRSRVTSTSYSDGATDTRIANITQLSPGDTAVIRSTAGNKELKARLLEMGLLPGTLFRFIKSAPFQGPVILKIRDYYVSIRWADAANIEVEIAP